ncbi:MAG: alpha-mannosidase [Anaerolineae bacterium]
MLGQHPDLFEKLQTRLKLIREGMVRDRQMLAPFELAYCAREDQHSAEWHALPFDHYWGEWVKDFLIRSRYQIPAHWALDAPIALHLPLGAGGDFLHPEALIYIDDASFTTVDSFHQLLPLPDTVKDHAPHTLLLDGWTGIGGTLEGDNQPRLYLKPCALVLIDPATREFVREARIALEVAQHLATDSPQQVALITIITRAFQLVDTRHPLGDAFYASIPPALDYLRESIPTVGEALDVTIYASGHAHIDTAWLWDIAQTRRKASRTFHTALYLMEQYPEYHFSQSQAQLYAFIEADEPALFARIQYAVEAGRWEVMGGMWVEADCNITGAESFARQFLYGRRYFRSRFGDDAPILWLPDTFGYPASIPQIAKEAGIDYFFTTKLRWNEHNDFPYDTFYWQGIDGTRILAHITPTPMQTWLRIATYNAEGNAQSVIETWQRMRRKPLQQMALMSYGWGDGGGGPTAEMLDNLERLKDYPAVPQVKQSSVHDFYQALEAQLDDVPIWNGELYLETHQGTLTSQAWIKRANRKAEVALHDVEWLATLASTLYANYTYPQSALDAVWQIVLLNQFHDILPGSSIREVYDDAREQYALATSSLDQLKQTALDVIGAHVDGDWVVLNTVDFAREGIAQLPMRLDDGQGICTLDGTPCLTQTVSEGTLIALPERICTPFAVIPLSLTDSAPASAPAISASTYHLDNGIIRAEFNDAGDCTRIIDHRDGRDLLAEDAIGNQFQLFEDRPLRFDAWNIDPEYQAQMWLAEPATVEVLEVGAVCATLKLTRSMMHSTLTQWITLYAGGQYLEFRTEIDWRERHMLLKVAFPLNVQARTARYHIQWGAVERPTHRNTSWDAAQYEVAAHHWADLGDTHQGVTLVNDCKYAYDTYENVMRLTLLKGATYPDPTADLGAHHFTYRLYARHGDSAWQAGYDLNYPLLVQRGTGDAPQALSPLVQVDDPQLIVETIKRSEDGAGVIVRAYAVATHPRSYTLTFNQAISTIWRVNFLEERQSQLSPIDPERVQITARPYEIISVYVEFKA